MKNRKSLIPAALALLAALVFTGCGSGGGSSTFAARGGADSPMASASSSAMSRVTQNSMEKSALDEAAGIPEEEAGFTDSGMDSTADLMAAEEARKIILRASFELETKEYSETLAAIHEEIRNTGSYVQFSDASGSAEDGNARSSMTVRVPSNRYEEFKAFVPTAGNVTYSSEGGEDVTTEYFDTDTRLRVLQAQETRILELLAQAKTVEELLQIENELTRIRTQIEQLTTQLKRFDDLVSYATVDLTIRQTRDYTPVGEKNFIERMGQAVKDSLDNLAEVLENGIIALIWMAPYLIFVGLVVLIVILAVRKSGKKKQQKPTPSSGSTPPPPPGFPPQK